jgi:hypothetical protein
MRHVLLLAGLSLLSPACGPRDRPALPSAPQVVSAEDLIPSDLDVVLRVDMARMKSALGAMSHELLAQSALARASDEAGVDSDPLLLESLLAADRVYFAYRPSALGLPTDRVWALDGQFVPLTSPPVGFPLPTDLGADLRFWERKPGVALQRTATARIYAQGERVRAFVSEAELDAVERTLTAPASPRRLRAPAEGALSVAARPGLLGRLASGSLRELLERAESLELVVDLASDRIELRAQLVLASAEHAQALLEAGRALLARAESDLASSATLQGEQDRIVLRASLSRAQLGPWLACLGPASERQCPW